MFVDKQKYNKGGKIYSRTLLRTSYRKDGKVKHKTIGNLSDCSDEEIEAIKIALKEKHNLVKCKENIDQTHLTLSKSIGAVYTLFAVANQLGITKALGKTREGKLALWLVIARIIDQGSRLSAVRLAKQHAICDIVGLESFNEDNLYCTLDWLNKNQLRIEKILFKDKYGENIPNLYLYDVTSSYLEGEHNELAAYGYSRDKKKGKSQIVAGLLTDPEGDPITIEGFEGNTQDPKTLHNQITKLADKFGCKDVTLVGDRGMIKRFQIDEIMDNDFHFITAITKPQIESLLKNGTIQLELFTENLCEIIDEDVRFILRRNPQRQIEINASRQSRINKIQELIAKKNQYLDEHQRAKENTALTNVKQAIKKLGLSDFIEVKSVQRTLLILIDEDKLHDLSKLDGCYVIKTDLKTNVMSAEKVHERYKDLKYVEEAFRMMKTELLEIRPVYLRTEGRTRGHLFEVMLAYKISRHLRKKWSQLECTVQEGVTILSMICGMKTQIGPLNINKIPEPTEDGKQLLDALGIVLPESIVDCGVEVATRKHINERRK